MAHEEQFGRPCRRLEADLAIEPRRAGTFCCFGGFVLLVGHAASLRAAPRGKEPVAPESPRCGTEEIGSVVSWRLGGGLHLASRAAHAQDCPEANPGSGRHNRETSVRYERRTWKMESLATGMVLVSGSRHRTESVPSVPLPAFHSARTVVDAVELVVRSPALPRAGFVASKPGDAVQAAAAVTQVPYRGFMIYAYPFGSAAPAPETGIVEPQHLREYPRRYRDPPAVGAPFGADLRPPGQRFGSDGRGRPRPPPSADRGRFVADRRRQPALGGPGGRAASSSNRITVAAFVTGNVGPGGQHLGADHCAEQRIDQPRTRLPDDSARDRGFGQRG